MMSMFGNFLILLSLITILIGPLLMIVKRPGPNRPKWLKARYWIIGSIILALLGGFLTGTGHHLGM